MSVPESNSMIRCQTAFVLENNMCLPQNLDRSIQKQHLMRCYQLDHSARFDMLKFESNIWEI